MTLQEQPPQSTLAVAVIGAGAFGQNHLRVYRSLQQAGANVRLTACVDPSSAVRDAVAAAYGIPVYPSVQALLTAGLAEGFRIDAASVCTPTIHHAAAAIALLGANIDVLIEKPIAPTLEEADAILLAAEEHGCILQVGHLERFNPAVTAAGALVNRPMFFEGHRLSVFTPRSLDVDVVLDLMIHDLDVVLTLAASPVREVRAVGLPVLSNKVDIANVRVEFESGAVANFTASRVSTERVRKLRFFQPHQYLSLDFARQDVLMIDVTAAASLSPAQMQALFAASGSASRNETHTAAEVETHLEALRLAQAAAPSSETAASVTSGSVTASASGESSASPIAADLLARSGLPGKASVPSHPSPGLSLRKVPTVPGEPLRLEIESFLHAARTRTAPEVTGAHGRVALALALQINHAIAEHAKRAGLVV